MPVPQTPWEQMVDRAMQSCIRVFGDGPGQVIITHNIDGALPYPIDGIFQAQSEVVDPGTQLKVVSNQPQISFRVSELQEMIDSGDTILIRGLLYEADSPIYDGHGTVDVPLRLIS